MKSSMKGIGKQQSIEMFVVTGQDNPINFTIELAQKSSSPPPIRGVELA
jgi:hypothetical protein